MAAAMLDDGAGVAVDHHLLARRIARKHIRKY
jgi:hypothetical protein